MTHIPWVARVGEVLALVVGLSAHSLLLRPRTDEQDLLL